MIRGGAATRELTPQTPCSLCGWPHPVRQATAIHDPLQAAALHLRGPSGGIIIISLDLFAMDSATLRTIRTEVARATSTPERRILITCTHNHSAPAVMRPIGWLLNADAPRPDTAWIDHVRQATVDAASEAAATTRSVGIAWTALAPGEPANCLVVNDLDNHRILSVVAITPTAANRLGIEPCAVSADFVGIWRRQLTERFGNQIVPLHLLAPAAEQVTSPTGQAEADAAGTHLADAVTRAIEELNDADASTTAELAAQMSPVDALPLRALPSILDVKLAWADARQHLAALPANATPLQQAAAQQAVASTEAMVSIVQAHIGGRLEKAVEASLPLDLQLVRIGTHALACFPGCIHSSFAAALRQAGHTLCPVSLANGDALGSIMPETCGGLHDLGPLGSVFSPEAGSILCDEMLLLAARCDMTSA